MLHVISSWWRSTFIRKSFSAGKLSLSRVRLIVGCVTTLWVQHPLSISQLGQLSLCPSWVGKRVATHAVRCFGCGCEWQNTWWEVWPAVHMIERYTCGLEYARCQLNGHGTGDECPPSMKWAVTEPTRHGGFGDHLHITQFLYLTVEDRTTLASQSHEPVAGSGWCYRTASTHAAVGPDRWMTRHSATSLRGKSFEEAPSACPARSSIQTPNHSADVDSVPTTGDHLKTQRLFSVHFYTSIGVPGILQ